MNFKFLHNTPSSVVEIKVVVNSILTQELKQYEDMTYFNDLCKSGCVNYNNKWSCPPYSPTYSLYSRNYKHCLLLLQFCDLSKFDYVKTDYMKVRASNSILKSQCDKLSRFLEYELAGKMMSSGSCRLCKPCSKKVSRDACKNPLKMRYSLEALGLNVEKISQDFFDHKLLWYKNKEKPLYSSVITGVLYNNNLEQNKLIELINRFYERS